jgi:hypothetical protein
MAINYREFVRRISPPWLRDFYGERFVGMVNGLMADLISEGASQAIKAHLLLSDTSPPDALPSIGDERNMPRYPSETDAQYRDRLHGAWDAWEFAGNEDGTGTGGIIGQLNAFGLANVTILPAVNEDPRVERPAWVFEVPSTVTLSGNFTYDDIGASTKSEITGADFEAAGFNIGWPVLVSGTTLNDGYYSWIFDVDSTTITLLSASLLADEGPVASTLTSTYWSRFAVIIGSPNPFEPVPTYGGGGHYSAEQTALTYGSGMTLGDIITVRSIIRKWKTGHAINPYIYVSLNGSMYGDPSIAYGDAGLVYGGTTAKIPHQV